VKGVEGSVELGCEIERDRVPGLRLIQREEANVWCCGAELDECHVEALRERVPARYHHACVGPGTPTIVQAMNTERFMLAFLTYEENA
jgi:hypothetical protein